MSERLKVLEHPEKYKAGTRVLFMKGRNKDGGDVRRMFTRVSHSPERFDDALRELLLISRPTERIYASAAPRSMSKAIRDFKTRQIAADYDADSELFYRAIMDRWVSCLMQPANAAEKIWLFDCDTDEEYQATLEELRLHYSRPFEPYCYKTKTGHHIVTQAFNRRLLSSAVQSIIDTNPLMLWAHPEAP